MVATTRSSKRALAADEAIEEADAEQSEEGEEGEEGEEDEEGEEGEDEEGAQEEMSRLAHDCFGRPPTWEAWNALVAGANRYGIELAELLCRPQSGQQELLDGSRLVRSSLGYDEEGAGGGAVSSMFQGERGLEMFRMLTGRHDCPQVRG